MALVTDSASTRKGVGPEWEAFRKRIAHPTTYLAGSEMADWGSTATTKLRQTPFSTWQTRVDSGRGGGELALEQRAGIARRYRLRGEARTFDGREKG